MGNVLVRFFLKTTIKVLTKHNLALVKKDLTSPYYPLFKLKNIFAKTKFRDFYELN